MRRSARGRCRASHAVMRANTLAAGEEGRHSAGRAAASAAMPADLSSPSHRAAATGRTDANASPPRGCLEARPSRGTAAVLSPPRRGPDPIVALTSHSARPGPRHPAGPAQAPPHSPPAEPPPEPPPPPRPPAAAPPAAAAAAPPRAGARRGSGAGPGGSAGRSCSPRARRRERAGGPEGEGRDGMGRAMLRLVLPSPPLVAAPLIDLPSGTALLPGSSPRPHKAQAP